MLFPGRLTSSNGSVAPFQPKMKKCHMQILQTVYARQGSANIPGNKAEAEKSMLTSEKVEGNARKGTFRKKIILNTH